jgi:hypothetical protein
MPQLRNDMAMTRSSVSQRNLASALSRKVITATGPQPNETPPA